ncbi:hypothetical protein [Pseudomonas silesiensis]
MTDISALEAYAGQLSEAAALVTASAQTQWEIINGDTQTDVLTESGLVPSLAKQAVLTEAKVTASLAVADALRQSLASVMSGSALVADKRMTLRSLADTVGKRLSAQNYSIWEFANFAGGYVAGGDPKTWDWAPAVEACIAAMRVSRRISVSGINDAEMLGGAEINFGGQEFFLSRPVILPAGVGGYTFACGSFSPAATFPLNGFLIDTLVSGATIDSVNAHNMFLNGANRASCVRFRTANIRCRWNVCTFFGFAQYGLFVTNYGIEFMCTDSYFFQNWSGTVIPGTYGIYTKTTSDQHFSDLVMAGVQFGVYSEGSTANRYTRVHVYGAEWSMYLQGITLANIVENCYHDGCKVWIDNPGGLTYVNNYHINGAAAGYNFVTLNALTPGHYAKGMVVTGNTFMAKLITARVEAFAKNGSFSNAEFTGNVIADNGSTDPLVNVKTTRMKARQVVVGASNGVMDFTDQYFAGDLLRSMRVTVRDEQGGVVRSVNVAGVSGVNSVGWKASGAVNGTIYLEIDTGVA